MENKEWALVLLAIIVIASVASFATVKMTGNVIYPSASGGSQPVYTKGEIDNLLNSQYSVIWNNLKSGYYNTTQIASLLSGGAVNTGGAGTLQWSTISVGKSSSAVGSLSCNSGQIALKGGCRVQGMPQDIKLTEDHPTFGSSQGWTCGAANSNALYNATLEVYVLCTSIPSGSTNSPTCVDSDGGLNYNVAGNASFGGYFYYDYCSGTKNVSERYCSGNGVSTSSYVCPGSCSNNRCI